MRYLTATVCGLICFLTAGAVIAAEFTPYLSSKPVDQARSSVGLRLTAKTLELAGDVTAEARGNHTYVAPKLSTNLALAPKLSMQTQVSFAEWNGRTSLLDEAAVETRIRARTPLPLVREIESSVWRGPNGALRQRVGVGLVENLGLTFDTDGRIKLNTQAFVEETARRGDVDRLVSGLQASLSGFGTGIGTTVASRLSLRYEAREGRNSRHTGTVAYHRAWRVNEFLRLSLDCEVVSAVESNGKLMLGWRADF